MRALLILPFLVPFAAQAQETRVTADLDGDGRAETFSLSAPVEGLADLAVETAQGTLVVPDAAFWGPMAGQEASLALTEGGSVQLRSGNDSVGRGRWALAVTIAHRGGELVVAGLTYSWRDTLDPTAGGTCDLNLLSGRGVLETAQGRREVAAPPPLTLRDWAAGAALPPHNCGTGT